MEKSCEGPGGDAEVPQINVLGNEAPTLAQLGDEDKAKLSEFRKLVEAEAKWAPKQLEYMDDYTLYRYLKARDWRFDAAKAMLVETMKWRAEFKPDEITTDMVASSIRLGGMYHHGYDRYCRPMIYLKVAEKPDPHTRLEKMQFMIFTLEQAIKRMEKERGVEKMVWCVNCKNYNFKYNGEFGFARELLSILQNHYPERLGVLILVDAPFVFRAFWKVISPFVDAKTLKKVVFVSGSKNEKRKILEEFIDLKDLPAKYFGDSDFLFDAERHIQWLKQGEEEKAKEKEEEKAKEKEEEKLEDRGKEEQEETDNKE